MTYDHHNGKRVKSVEPGENESIITFETGDVIRVPGSVSPSVVGQALLLAEPGQLVFGMPQAYGPAIRMDEISVPDEAEVLDIDKAHEKAAAKPKRTVKKAPTGGRGSRSRGAKS